MRGSTGGMLRSIPLRISMISSSTIMFVSISPLSSQLIGPLGGIDVENDQEFMSLHGKFHFPVGKVHLNSEQALGFVRERYFKVATMTVGKPRKSHCGHYQKVDLYQGLKQLQWDYRKPPRFCPKPIMQLPTMMNLINTQLETGGSYEDFSSDHRSRTKWLAVLCHAWLQSLCNGVGSPAWPRQRKPFKK